MTQIYKKKNGNLPELFFKKLKKKGGGGEGLNIKA